MKYTIYIAIALFVIFVGVHFTWRYRKRKEKEKEKKTYYEDPRYIELEEEKEAIKRKRSTMEIDHPYQKYLSSKIQLEKAQRMDNKEDIEKYERVIERLLKQYEADEKLLEKAYTNQLAAMSKRLSQIEIEQRHILLEN